MEMVDGEALRWVAVVQRCYNRQGFGTYLLIHTAKALQTYPEESGTSPGQEIHPAASLGRPRIQRLRVKGPEE